jgi:hypothetical protein
MPDMETAVAWDLREMGPVWEEGVRAGLGHLKREKISSRYPAKAGTTWRRMRKNNPIRRVGGGSARTEWAAI